ncbi:hypothetical protein BKA00_006410 [Actinomadura coerulea]|uniref:Uncharacterized protein n=1 Tax=Actinomadura coerulea TaxID=46159 RepID=A0A7X0L296_9ACTN|nr:hypothetical protein [Actinomadura coerulea]
MTLTPLAPQNRVPVRSRTNAGTPVFSSRSNRSQIPGASARSICAGNRTTVHPRPCSTGRWGRGAVRIDAPPRTRRTR